MISLQTKMGLLLTLLFAIIYAITAMIGAVMGIHDFYFYLFLSIAIMGLQYWLGPKIVEWTMGVRYVANEEYPELHAMVAELAKKAGLPMPRIGIAKTHLPNAFAFGRGIQDGRVCVTEGIIGLLEPAELKAVLGHEISHIKNRDVLTITLLSVVPMILYRVAWHLMWFGDGSGRRRDGESAPSAALIGLVAFIFYFLTNLLVLYASRIREYFADRGSIALGNQPAALASALYKLVYGSARMDKEELKDVEGIKAFFVNDPSQAMNEFRDLKQLDKDKSGTIDPAELEALRHKAVRLSLGDHLLEMLGTHPNMLKRISELSKQAAIRPLKFAIPIKTNIQPRSHCRPRTKRSRRDATIILASISYLSFSRLARTQRLRYYVDQPSIQRQESVLGKNKESWEAGKQFRPFYVRGAGAKGLLAFYDWLLLNSGVLGNAPFVSQFSQTFPKTSISCPAS